MSITEIQAAIAVVNHFFEATHAKADTTYDTDPVEFGNLQEDAHSLHRTLNILSQFVKENTLSNG